MSELDCLQAGPITSINLTTYTYIIDCQKIENNLNLLDLNVPVKLNAIPPSKESSIWIKPAKYNVGVMQ